MSNNFTTIVSSFLRWQKEIVAVNNNEHYKEFKEHYKELEKRIKFKLAYFMMTNPAGTCMHGRERERGHQGQGELLRPHQAFPFRFFYLVFK